MKKYKKKNDKLSVIFSVIAIAVLLLFYVTKDDTEEIDPSSLEDLQLFAENFGFSCKIGTEVSEGDSVNVLQCTTTKMPGQTLSLFAIAQGKQTASGSIFLVIEKTKGVTSKINSEIFSKGFEAEIYKGIEIRTVTEGNIETSIMTTDKYVIASASTSNSKRLIKELIDR